MTKRIFLLFFILSVGLVGLSGCSTTNPNQTKNIGPSVTSNQWEGLAKALTASGATMYGAYWCSHCKDQEEMFGPAWQYAPYIESADPDNPYKQTPAAIQAGIQAYPTWIFADGSRVEKVMSFDELAKKINYTPSQ